MAQSRVTLKEIMTAVRELSFDRFIIPAFAIKAMPDHTITVDKDWLPDPDDSLVPEETIAGCLTIKKADKTELTLPFQKYQTMEEVMDALQAAGIIVAFTPYFRGVEPSTALIALKERDINENITLFRRYFFSDEEIIGILRDYYCQVLDFHSVFFNQREIDDDLVGRLIRPSERHMALWVAYHIVEKRRLYEQAAAAIGQSFTDGSDYVGSDVSQSMGTTTTTQIGSVFTITEDPSKGFFYEDFNRVGSDNVLGDRYSFWYKLQLWLRDQIEEMFGDYSLRKNTVFNGYTELVRELDFRSYYDSYPFTLSPLSRGILSKTP